jgi:CHASE3 domain sensor protein
LFVVIVFGVAVTIALSYRAIERVIRNEDSINHTYRVMARLDAALAALTAAESGQRGPSLPSAAVVTNSDA